MSVSSDSFCVLPWIHVSCRTNGDLQLCCSSNSALVRAKGSAPTTHRCRSQEGKVLNLNEASITSAFNCEFIRKVRLEMLSGKKPDTCAKCFKEESIGLRSKRMWENADWESRVDFASLVSSTDSSGAVEPQIKYLDLKLGNNCNLKCVSCSPVDSSRWVSDRRQLAKHINNNQLLESLTWDEGEYLKGAYNWYQKESFWQELRELAPQLREVYIIGGEVTLLSQYREFLRFCIDEGLADSMNLRLSTNGTGIDQNLINLWEKFNRVKVHFSLDAVGNRNEFLRYPSSWNQIIENLRKLDHTPENIKVDISCTVSLLNVYHLPELIDWKLNQGFKKINAWPDGAGLIQTHFAYFPNYLNIKALPTSMKQVVAKRFREYYPLLLERFKANRHFASHPSGIAKLDKILKFMNEENWSHLWPQTVDYLNGLDKVRGTSFTQAIPELAQI